MCKCFSGYNFYSYVCESINLFMTLSSREASGQGLCIRVSVGIIFSHVCEGINLLMILSSRQASGQGLYIVFFSRNEFILTGRPSFVYDLAFWRSLWARSS